MIGSTVNFAEYAGNGSTSTAYVIPFRYDAAGWVYVTVTDALGNITDLEQVTDYTLAGDGTTEDGTFTTIAVVPATSTVRIYREAPGTQSLSLPANNPLPAPSVEAQLDRLAMAAADSVTARAMAERIAEVETAAGKQPLDPNLTAYAADPTATILANMPDALSGVGDPSGGAAPAVASSVVIDPTGTNNTIRFFANTPGLAGNSIRIQYASPSVESTIAVTHPFTSVVVGTPYLITITPGSGGATAAQIITAVNDSFAPISAEAVGNVTGIVAPVAATNFTEGSAAISGTPVLASFVGQEYHDISDPDNVIVWFWNGTAWQLAGGSSGGEVGDAYAVSHEADTTAHAASSIVNTPSGSVVATTVQAAINELDSEKAPTANPVFTESVTVPDAALSIAKTSGLRGELDGKASYDLREADVINFQPHAMAKAAIDNVPLRIANMGDSLTSLGAISIGPNMGVVGSFGTGWTVASGTSPTPNSSFSDWMFGGSGRGNSSQFIAGSTVEMSCGRSSSTPIQGDRFSLYIIKKPGGGTFDVQVSSNNSGSWTTLTTGTHGFDGLNVSAANATPLGFVITGSLSISARPAYKLRITNITGAGVSVIGAGIYYSTGKGVITMGDLLNAGGVDFPSPLDTPQAIYEPILRDMAVDLVLSCWADGSPNWQSGGNFENLVSRITTSNSFTLGSCVTTFDQLSVTHPATFLVKAGMRVSGTGIPLGSFVQSIISSTQFTINARATAAGTITASFSNPTDVVQISAHPLTVATALTTEAAAIEEQREWAVRNKQSFLNMHTVFKSAQWMFDNGYKTDPDDAHLTTRGGLARWGHVWSRLPIGSMSIGGAMGSYDTPAVFKVSGGGGANDPIYSSRPLLLTGAVGGIILQDRSNLHGEGNSLNLAYANVGELFLGPSLVFSGSSLSGIHPISNNLMLGGRGNFRFRLGGTGIQLGYRETTIATTFATDDHTIEVTSGSPAITLPAATPTNASTSAVHNVAAGIAGKIFILANTGAGTPSIVGTVSGSVNPTLAAQTTWIMQSTGVAWKLLSKTPNAP